jgi:hypothetical protein
MMDRVSPWQFLGGIALLALGASLLFWGPKSVHDVALLLIGTAVPTKAGAFRKDR